MTFDPAAAHLALRATQAHVASARPGAPVVAEPAARAPRAAGLRSAAAAGLHQLARRVEPTPRSSCQPG